MSRVKDEGAHIAVGIPDEFEAGLPQAAAQHGEAWRRIGRAFPELENLAGGLNAAPGHANHMEFVARIGGLARVGEARSERWRLVAAPLMMEFS